MKYNKPMLQFKHEQNPVCVARFAYHQPRLRRDGVGERNIALS